MVTKYCQILLGTSPVEMWLNLGRDFGLDPRRHDSPRLFQQNVQLIHTTAHTLNTPITTERTDVTLMAILQTQLPSLNSSVPRKETVVRRRLRVADRTLIQLATSVVRGDPIKSLVELITNSDDSYRRKEHLNETSHGRTIVTLDYQCNSITALDFAEGIEAKSMDECVGTYGAEMSGFGKGCFVRGFYGRGLKEAILGLGSGIIMSIKDGYYNECRLREDGLYLRRERRRASLSDYLDLGIPYGRSGTKILILFSKTRKMPRFEWIKYALINHTSLRDIMQSPHRRVILTDGQRSEILMYTPPPGKLVLQKKTVPIPGFDSTLDLTVYMSDRPLSQEGYTREGGLLIRSKSAVHDATLFKFDYSPYAARLFGEVRCDYVDELMAKGELVVNDKRDGLDLHHPFTKALRKVVEAELQPLVDRDMALHEKETLVSEDLRRRFDNVLWEVNRLAVRLMRDNVRYGRPPVGVDRANCDSTSREKSDVSEPRTPKKGATQPMSPIFFRGIRLNPYQDPRVRVYFDTTTRMINIATRAPSVAMYYGQSLESKEFLTLIAELVSDIVCFELATTISGNGKSELMPEIFNSLKNKYAHVIHKIMRAEAQAEIERGPL